MLMGSFTCKKLEHSDGIFMFNFFLPFFRFLFMLDRFLKALMVPYFTFLFSYFIFLSMEDLNGTTILWFLSFFSCLIELFIMNLIKTYDSWGMVTDINWVNCLTLFWFWVSFGVVWSFCIYIHPSFYICIKLVEAIWDYIGRLHMLRCKV